MCYAVCTVRKQPYKEYNMSNQKQASHIAAKLGMYPPNFTDLVSSALSKSDHSPAMQNVLLQTQFIAQNGFAMSTAQRKKLQLSLGFTKAQCK